jgi:hypothetical protein
MNYIYSYPQTGIRIIADWSEDKNKAIAVLKSAKLRLLEEITEIDEQISKLKEAP